MTYLAAQIFFFILVTFVLAFVFGWWSRGRQKVEAVAATPAAGESPPADDGELERVARERNELEHRCRQGEATLEELQGQLTEARRRILALEVERDEARDEQQGRASVLAEGEVVRTTTISESIDPFEDPASIVLAEPDGAADDLRRIRGLGRVLEMRLHELGVFHFRQLAGLAGYDFNWLAAKLGFSPERLRDLGWSEQAAELMEEDRAGFETQPGVEPRETV